MRPVSRRSAVAAIVAIGLAGGAASTTVFASGAPGIHAIAPAGTAPTGQQAALLAQEDAEINQAPATGARPAAVLQPNAQTTGNRTLCRDASVREADKAHVVGYAFKGNVMNVDHYATHVNPSNATSLWAYGTVSAPAGHLTGYVLYDSGTFC